VDYLAIAMAGAALIAAAAALVLAWQAKQLSAPERVDQLEALITQQAPSEILARIETDLAQLHSASGCRASTAAKKSAGS